MEQDDKQKEQPQDDQEKRGPEKPPDIFPAEIKLVIDKERRITLNTPFPVPDTAFMFLRALLVLGSMQPQAGPTKEESSIIRPGGGPGPGNAGPFKRKP